jgi:hypothetical protein
MTAHFCPSPPPPRHRFPFLTTDHRPAKRDIIATNTKEGATKLHIVPTTATNYDISFPLTGENARDSLSRQNPVVLQSENGTGYDISFHLTKSQP